jgi:hypothetical protein
MNISYHPRASRNQLSVCWALLPFISALSILRNDAKGGNSLSRFQSSVRPPLDGGLRPEGLLHRSTPFTSTAAATFSAGRKFSTLYVDSVESIKNHTGSFLRQLNTWLRATSRYLVDSQIPQESTGILRPDTSFVPSIPEESGIPRG